MGNTSLVGKLCRFIGLGEDHLNLIAEFSAGLLARRDVLAKQFYWYLLTNEETSKLIVSLGEAGLARLMTSQTEYIEAMLTCPVDAAHAEKVVALGRMHHRLGVSPVWLCGAYERYLGHLLAQSQVLAANDEQRLKLDEALRKRVLLDILLQLHGHTEAADAKTREHHHSMFATARLYATLSKVSLALIHATGRDELFRSICRICVEEGGFSHAWIGRLDGGTLSQEAVCSHRDHALPANLVLQIDTDDANGPSARAVRTQRPQVINDIANDASMGKWTSVLMEAGVRSLLVSPLILCGETVGTLVLYSVNSWFFDQDTVGLVQTMTSEIGYALERQDALERSRRAESELAYLIQHDKLTGLPNRQRMTEKLAQLIAGARPSGRVASIAVAIDGFHDINARLGHECGDIILREVALRLSQIVLPSGSVGRVGAARFVIISDRFDMLDGLVGAVMASFEDAVDWQTEKVYAVPSVGIVVEAADTADPGVMMRRADLALTRAREAGGGQVRYYDAAMDEEIHRLHRIRAEFAEALRGDGLELFYQPKINLKNHRVCGVEALVRWRRDGGYLAPGAFFPAIDHTDLMRELDWWVMEEALRHSTGWLGQGRSIPISVNLSAMTLQHSDFLSRVQALIMRYPIPDGHLELEVLETISQKEAEAIVHKLAACREIGVSIALDDFGTGASSLVHLQQLPFDTIKIDQRFVRMLLEAPGNEAIIRSMISFAHYTGRQLVVEGVESQPIWDRLLELGCSSGQGYAISPPVNSGKLMEWIGELELASPDPDFVVEASGFTPLGDQFC
ncbi:EAL domain-containing protein [Paludibacterium paludis]|uniref:Diguanylate cyclase DosC n=2 Tax=Paludibacterium paludis TaxID=1225769 RepID=A0A918P4H4_9NEIS|nr:EAL domain-containing protein [Paludibacterium paludis]GGY20278.1 hypothetical protein GCM10011289_24800 [Paludibacterium paludis]